MANKNVFILDDEFPKNDKFVEADKYSSAISADDLYQLAVTENWKSLKKLQQLVKNIRDSSEYLAGNIQLSGYSNPEFALNSIDEGVKPDILIYDWQYGSELNNMTSKDWLLEIFERTSAFVFVYSAIEPHLSRILNENIFDKYRDRLQLFLKGGEIPQSFTSEEFIYQYIVNSVSNNISFHINGVKIDFKANNYLAHASDILYLQRILGSGYFLNELSKIGFEVNDVGVERILDDTHKFIYFDSERKILIDPKELESRSVNPKYDKLSFADVIRNFSLEVLEDTLDRGFYVMNN